ncbi:Sterile alpha motif type 2 [Penicillium herquei]|nr:Sterile alpha motif type 2 [Penicillium herquei]
MNNQYAYDLGYMMQRKQEPLPLFPPMTATHRPYSAATEIYEDELRYDESPMRSVASFDTGSNSTLSTPDNVPTPNSTGLTTFDFHIDEKNLRVLPGNVRGPSGPHLFGSSMESDVESDLEIDVITKDKPGSVSGPYHHQASKFDPWRRDTPYSRNNFERVPAFHRLSTVDWSPDEVVQWMQSLGFDDDIRQKFYQNDISGTILLELQTEDLKELDISSFGKRHRLMNSIQSLRGGSSVSSTAPSSSRNSSVTEDRPSTAATSTIVSTNSHQSLDSYKSHNSCHSQLSFQSCSTDDDTASIERPRRRRQQSSPEVEVRKVSDIQPGDSVSIVAIEQLLPRPHNCSKGEDCRKWQKQRAKIARLAQDLPIETFGGRAIVAGDPGNPKTAPNLLKPSHNSEVPSLVASSDALGPRQASFQLSQDKLKEVQPRDPQENVRNFLNFQRLSKLQTANDPATPPREFSAFDSDDSESPDSAKVTPTLAENLRSLPRLHIPSMHGSERSSMTDSVSALKTVTPSVLYKHNQLYANEMTAIPRNMQSQFHGASESPADYYRTDPCYRQETPFSETDAPITAVPIDAPVAREDSQSVPPDMRFGNKYMVAADPIIRPSTTRGSDSYRHYQSNRNSSNLNTLKEDRILSPIETPEDLRTTPRAPYFRSEKIFDPDNAGQEGITHSGWMKKRKTTRLLRHEWEKHHFTLKGTQLGMHDDDKEQNRHSKALEYVDVDDYAVACSSLASSSKLSAAFKKTILKRRDSAPDDSAFAFSLIPAPNHNGGVIDRKTMFMNSGKSHHFAVKSRDERIDWMRELMLAKALKRGRQTGAALNMNGNMI